MARAVRCDSRYHWNHPALRGLNLPPLGRPGNNGGTLVTKTLLVAGESNFGPTPNGQRGAMSRAFDKATGAEVGALYMPAPQSGSPMRNAGERDAISRGRALGRWAPRGTAGVQSQQMKQRSAPYACGPEGC